MKNKQTTIVARMFEGTGESIKQLVFVLLDYLIGAVVLTFVMVAAALIVEVLAENPEEFATAAGILMLPVLVGFHLLAMTYVLRTSSRIVKDPMSSDPEKSRAGTEMLVAIVGALLLIIGKTTRKYCRTKWKSYRTDRKKA